MYIHTYICIYIYIYMLEACTNLRRAPAARDWMKAPQEIRIIIIIIIMMISMYKITIYIYIVRVVTVIVIYYMIV